MATEGRVSPVRSQCQSDVLTMSSRTQRCYRKKAEQAIEGVLESIAPGNASWLYHQVMQRRIRLQAAEGIVEDTLVARLVILYEEAANWYTRQQILSLFENDYSKSELLALIPGLSKWRIDEARKHAFRVVVHEKRQDLLFRVPIGGFLIQNHQSGNQRVFDYTLGRF